MQNRRNACDLRFSLYISLEVPVPYSFVFQCSRKFTRNLLIDYQAKRFIVLHKLFFLDFLNHSLRCYVDFRAISMGQGQEVHARKLVGSFMQNVSLVYIALCQHSLIIISHLLTLFSVIREAGRCYKTVILVLISCQRLWILLLRQNKFTKTSDYG